MELNDTCSLIFKSKNAICRFFFDNCEIYTCGRSVDFKYCTLIRRKMAEISGKICLQIYLEADLVA